MSQFNLKFFVFLVGLSTCADASVLKCEHLFIQNYEIEILAQQIAELSFELEQKPELYANPAAALRASEKITSDLSALRNFGDSFLKIYFAELKKLRTLRNDEEQSLRKEKAERLLEQKEENDPAYIGRRMLFHPILPGKFLKGSKDQQIETEITEPFSIMTTPVTQKMWATIQIARGEPDLNNLNPSRFKTGPGSEIISINGINVQMKPTHPVESASIELIQVFIRGLNRLSKSEDPIVQKKLLELIPSHQKGDIYDLPTADQWDLVYKNRGNNNKEFFDRDDNTELQNYAWLKENSNFETHAVGTKLPRIIADKPIYSLEGNVTEWTKDFRGPDKIFTGPDQPGDTTPGYRVQRGGSWITETNNSDNFYTTGQFGNAYEGFRLVSTRTLPNSPPVSSTSKKKSLLGIFRSVFETTLGPRNQ
jgi:formylglycine-generating enzyme required for sulfatase activity